MFSFTLLPSFQSDQASGIRLAVVMQNFTNIATSVIISFVFGWELTLLILGIGPIIASVTIIGMNVLTGQAAEDKKELEMAGKVGIFYCSSSRTSTICWWDYLQIGQSKIRQSKEYVTATIQSEQKAQSHIMCNRNKIRWKKNIHKVEHLHWIIYKILSCMYYEHDNCISFF